MDLAGFDWTLIAIVGAIVLALIIAFVALRKRSDPGSAAGTEEATRRNYEDEDRAHRGESDNVP